MVSFTTRTAKLKAANGQHIRTVTVVRADWGSSFCEVTFTERMPKGAAIRQAKEMLLRDGTISPHNC